MTDDRLPATLSTRATLLGWVLAVFFFVILISAVLVGIFETDRNGAAIQQTATALLEDDVAQLRQAIASDQVRRHAALRDRAEGSDFVDAVQTRDARLHGLLFNLRAQPLFDFVGVALEDGTQVPRPGPGSPLLPSDGWDELRSGAVLADPTGRHFLVVAPDAADGALLVGGVELDQQMALELREAQGAGEVVLVVDGVVVAPGPDGGLPPGIEEGMALPSSPEILRANQGDRDVLAGYAAIVPPSDLGPGLHVGLVVADPFGELTAVLQRNRLVSLGMLAAVGLGLALVLLRLITRPVSELTVAATRIADGELEHDFQDIQGVGELEALAWALDRMLQRLRSNTATIQQQSQALQRAAERLVTARDDERRRMAGTLHDAFQQRLVVLRMRLAALGEQVPEDQRRDLADEVLALLTDLRRLSHDLYPSILRDRGLGAALHSLVGSSAADVDLELDPEPFPRLPFDLEANAYFVVSEAVTNALKHAPGSPVHVTARVFERELEVCVIDRGPGFDLDTDMGSGLVGLEDRAQAMGGKVLLSSDHNGTWVVARVPLLPDDDRPAASREHLDHVWAQLMAWDRHVLEEMAAGRPRPVPPQDASASALQEQQDGGDAPVEVRGV